MSLREWMIDYSERIIAGETVACEKHRWACQRFLRDAEREGSDEFPYVFDEEKAIRFLRWMSLFKHTKGVLQGRRIEPHPIQVFVFGNIYGWVHRDTRRRRFRKAYWQVGRKNAKSQSLACVGSYESMALGENEAEVYVGATHTKQSRIVWKEISSQLKGCTDLKGKYQIRYGNIEHPKSGSFIAALSREAGETGDGFNPQCGIIDEYHAHKTSGIYDVLVSGMGARPQPLIMVITTAGYELSYPCYAVEYEYVSKLLDPDVAIENDEYFAMVNELDKGDNVQDETVWEKANPILCSYEEGISYLRGELRAALDVPQKMRTFLTKNMDMWVDRRDNGYMPMDKWKACGLKAGEKLPDLTGKECIAGVDLSAKIDLTSVGFEFKLEDGRYLALSHSFMPEDTLSAKRKTDKVPYDLWVEQGWLSVTPGAVVDYRFIMKYIQDFETRHKCKVKEGCYDQYNATQFATEMSDLGYTMVEIRQGTPTLGEPTKNFREEVMKANVLHDNNPVLSWAMSNAVTRTDHNENIMLDKKKASQRIDPAASLINAHVRAMTREPVKKSVYEERGPRRL